jgi:hypothetical protein
MWTSFRGAKIYFKPFSFCHFFSVLANCLPVRLIPVQGLLEQMMVIQIIKNITAFIAPEDSSVFTKPHYWTLP